MTTISAQRKSPSLPPRLLQRLSTLGLTALTLSPDGEAQPTEKPRWIERVILRSTLFRRHVVQLWPRLISLGGADATSSGQGCVELWPGLWLAVLRTERRRPRAGTPASAPSSSRPIGVVLLVGRDCLQAEQFYGICDEQELDYRVAVAKTNPRDLLGREEAHRLALTIGWLGDDAHESGRRVGDLEQLSRELSESYEELSLLYRFSTSITPDQVNQPPANFLSQACDELQQVAGLDWLALQIIEDEPRLEDLAGRLFLAGCPGDSFDPEALRPLGRKLLRTYGDDDRFIVLEDTRGSDLPLFGQQFRTLLAVPLRDEHRPLALLFGGNGPEHPPLRSGDAKLCNSVGNSLSIFLQNLMLFDDLQALFMGALHALTRAIDAKDAYTLGHSERVALLSRMLAQAAGLPADTVERIHIAAMIHDVGKIGVPEAVLTKPGRLTDEEFGLIKAHPEIGARILDGIRQMNDLIPGVLYHHERWDGRGYPHQLAGENIPLFGRVIGLADAFDAMSSNRTYRAALDRGQVLAEVERCRGSQFDPELAQTFLTLDFAPFDAMIRKHQQQQAPSVIADC